AASISGPEGAGSVGSADAGAVRRGRLDRVSANADARHPRRVRAAMRIPVIFIFVSSFILHPSSLLKADGGTLCLLERAGGYRVAVFSAPTPLRAGPVDISVLVQHASTGEQVPGARVTVRLKQPGTTGSLLEYRATTEAATNKLFHAAKFDLPEPGR